MIAVPKCLAWSLHVPLKVELTHFLDEQWTKSQTDTCGTQSKVKINHHATAEKCICFVLDNI